MISPKNRLLSLLAIVFLGLFFRMYHLDRESIWLDEASSISTARLNLEQIFFQPENTPPLYWIILHGWISLFGVSESSLRFISAIFGSLSILMIYIIGIQLFDISVARISSLLMAFSVFHIEYSQEARTYSLSVLLTLISMYFFIKLLKKVSYGILIGYVLSSILLIYSHIYGLFIITAQNMYFVVLSLSSNEAEKPSFNFKKWIITQSILIFSFLPWANIFISQVHVVQKDFWIPTPHIFSIISSFKTYSSGSYFIYLLFLILSLFSFISYEKIYGSRDMKLSFKYIETFQWKINLLNTDRIFFLLIWLIIPNILPFIISLFSQPIYLAKYTIVASPALYLLVASGVKNMNTNYANIIKISIIILLSIQITKYYTKTKKEQWREVSNHVDIHARNGDILLLNTHECIEPFNYYSRNDLLVKNGISNKNIDIYEENINELWKIVKPYNRVWLILSHSGDKKELIKNTLIESFKLSYDQEYKGIKLYLFEKAYANTAAPKETP